MRWEARTEPWWAPVFSGSEGGAESPRTGLIKRSHQGRRETRMVSQRSNKDRFRREGVIS